MAGTQSVLEHSERAEDEELHVERVIGVFPLAGRERVGCVGFVVGRGVRFVIGSVMTFIEIDVRFITGIDVRFITGIEASCIIGMRTVTIISRCIT